MAKKVLFFSFSMGLIFILGIVFLQFSFFKNEIKDISIKEDISIEIKNLPESKASRSEVSAWRTKDTVLENSDLYDIKEWHKADVFTADEANQDYASYAENTLQELSEAGDVRAMKVLVLRYLEESKETTDLNRIVAITEKSNALIEKAIIYGDRELLGVMPEKSIIKSRLISPSATPEQKHAATIDALAYAEFMGLRGSLGLKYEEQKSFFSTYKNFGIPTSLTPSDKAKIRTRAKEIYDSYEQQRVNLGLGSFDSSLPEGKRKSFEMQKEIYLKEMGDNAI